MRLPTVQSTVRCASTVPHNDPLAFNLPVLCSRYGRNLPLPDRPFPLPEPAGADVDPASARCALIPYFLAPFCSFTTAHLANTKANVGYRCIG
jgi:hypothetical protein